MEHEISGHSRKVYKIWKNPAMPFWKKFKEIAIEVLIIVFAVSFAAFLEREREHGNEQKQVKEFLLGLKTDLQNDIAEMEGDKKSYVGTGKIFSYLVSLPASEKANGDTIKKYQKYLLNTTGLVTNDGRYQGFKSSGKISTIDNIELQNDILDLYQENIPNLILNTTLYTQRKEVLYNYIFENLKRLPNGSNNMLEILSAERAYNISLTLADSDEVIKLYNNAINKSKKIIAAIDHEYH